MNNSDIVTYCIQRWFADLKRQATVQAQPLSWQNDFGGEIETRDYVYVVFLILLSFVPATLAAYASHDEIEKVLMRFFRTPIKVVVDGLLTAGIIFIGAHLAKATKSWSVAFKLMLRTMAIYPLLGFFLFAPWGVAIQLLFLGIFVVRGVRRTYPISLQNSVFFFGTIYIVFAILELQAVFRGPPKEAPSDPFKNFSNARPTENTTADLGTKR